MKKIAKISLVAAIAVAGFTTANAQPLEEAIKNVDVTGSVVYRYNDYQNDGSNAGVPVAANSNSQSNQYKVAVALSSKVNDDVKFNSRVIVGNKANAGFVQLGNTPATTASDDNNTTDAGDTDTNAEITLSQANFSFTGIKNTTVIAGKQGLTTPWTVAIDSDGNEQTGTGLLALSTVGPVTLAGAYFSQTNLNESGDAVGQFNTDGLGNEDLATAGAIVAAGPVTLDAWYVDAQDKFDSYTVGAKSAPEFAGIKFALEARHTALDLTANTADNSLTKFVASGDAGLIDAKLAYAMTDKEGGTAALDNDAATNLLGWSLSANGKADADYIQAVVGVDILSNLNLSANYGNLQYVTSATTEVEEEEVYAQLLYKMSKNLSTYVRYGTYEKDTTTTTTGTSAVNNDDTRGRLQVEYTF
jgi:hypothetical protein